MEPGTRWRWLAVFLAVSACNTMPWGWLREVPGPYGKTLRANTRSFAVYRGLQAICFVYATNETEAFKQARTERLAQVYHVAEPNSAKLDSNEPLAQGKHVFFLALSTADRYANNLEHPSSQWGITLETPKGNLQPGKILRMSAKPVEVQAFFPYFDRFFVGYLIRFRRTWATARTHSSWPVQVARHNSSSSDPSQGGDGPATRPHSGSRHRRASVPRVRYHPARRYHVAVEAFQQGSRCPKVQSFPLLPSFPRSTRFESSSSTRPM